MKVGFKATGYNGVRSTPGLIGKNISMFRSDQASPKRGFVLLHKEFKTCAWVCVLTEHDWDVREKEGQVD